MITVITNIFWMKSSCEAWIKRGHLLFFFLLFFFCCLKMFKDDWHGTGNWVLGTRVVFSISIYGHLSFRHVCLQAWRLAWPVTESEINNTTNRLPTIMNIRHYTQIHCYQCPFYTRQHATYVWLGWVQSLLVGLKIFLIPASAPWVLYQRLWYGFEILCCIKRKAKPDNPEQPHIAIIVQWYNIGCIAPNHMIARSEFEVHHQSFNE